MGLMDETRPVQVHLPTVDLVNHYLDGMRECGTLNETPICGLDHAMWEVRTYWQLAAPHNPEWLTIDINLVSVLMAGLN